MPAPVPANEAVRLASLHAAAILDTPPEAGFEESNAPASISPSVEPRQPSTKK